MNATKGILQVEFVRNPLINNSLVSVGFNCKLADCVLNQLKSCSRDCFPAGGQEAIVCFSLFVMVKDALTLGINAMKFKVNDVQCAYVNGQFVISYDTKANVSAVRKSLNAVLKNLNPNKTYSIYSMLIKSLNQSANKEEFNYAAGQVLNCIKKSVQVLVLSSIKVVADIGGLVEVVHSKLSLEEVKNDKTKPSNNPCQCNANNSNNADTHDVQTELKVSGTDLALLYMFLSSKLRGVGLKVCGDSLCIRVKQKSYESLKPKLNKAVNDYAAKFAKLKDNVAVYVAHQSILNGALNVSDASKCLKSKMSVADVKKHIEKGL